MVIFTVTVTYTKADVIYATLYFWFCPQLTQMWTFAITFWSNLLWKLTWAIITNKTGSIEWKWRPSFRRAKTVAFYQAFPTLSPNLIQHQENVKDLGEGEETVQNRLGFFSVKKLYYYSITSSLLEKITKGGWNI